jgi:glycosyltransferase involved in cell wall biosynthesis
VKIALVGPEQALPGGNTTTATRWRALLAELGHDLVEPAGADLLVALHARRSAEAIARFPGPVVVAATGTDLYLDLGRAPETLASYERAWRIVTLHPRAAEALPEPLRARARPILQSVVPLARPPAKDEPIHAVVIGHLRAVKNPLLAGRALRHVSGPVRVTQIGGALEEALGREARALEAREPRFRWVGAVPGEEALRRLAAATVLVVSSVLEGGANVIGEAVVHGVPPLCSRIPGNTGLVGEDWPALFAVGDERGLAELLERGATDELLARTEALRPSFAREREIEAWRALLAE